MKIKIDQQFELKLNQSKGKIVMSSQGKLFLLSDFTIIEEDLTVTKGLFKKTSEVIRQKYLTKIDINSYHSTGKFLGVLTDEAASIFIYSYDFYKMRENWNVFKDVLKAFGLQVIRIPEGIDDVALRQAAEDHMKEYFPTGYTNQADIINFAVDFHKLQRSK